MIPTPQTCTGPGRFTHQELFDSLIFQEISCDKEAICLRKDETLIRLLNHHLTNTSWPMNKMIYIVHLGITWDIVMRQHLQGYTCMPSVQTCALRIRGRVVYPLVYCVMAQYYKSHSWLLTWTKMWEYGDNASLQ